MNNTIPLKTELPSWDLSDLYKSTQSRAINFDLRKLEKLTINFNKKYKGKVHKLTDKKFYDLFNSLENIEKLSGRLISYSYLNYCENVSCEEKNKFLSNIQEKIVKFESNMLFLSLEINSISEKKFRKLIAKKSRVKRYETFFNK